MDNFRKNTSRIAAAAASAMVTWALFAGVVSLGDPQPAMQIASSQMIGGR